MTNKEEKMSDFWKNILTMMLGIVVKIIEKLLGADIDGDGKVGM